MVSIRALKRDLELISRHISRLVKDKFSFQEDQSYILTQKIIKQNKIAHSVASHYIRTAILGILREVNGDGKSKSLLNFLEEIRAGHALFTYKAFSAKYPQAKFRMAQRVSAIRD